MKAEYILFCIGCVAFGHGMARAARWLRNRRHARSAATEEYLRRMARRHHITMQKLDALRCHNHAADAIECSCGAHGEVQS
jgi:hypothetical protein